MVKSYLKFEHSQTFGQICTASANVVCDQVTGDQNHKGGAGRAHVGANESVLVWDIKTSELVDTWAVEENKAAVSAICRSKIDLDVFAVGYEDGKIRIWDSRTATVVITFNGHKSAVTQLEFGRTGARLASGSKDTDIILWDLVAEVGLHRLRGHKDQITSLSFISPGTEDAAIPQLTPDALLLSTGKDALIKVWDLATQHCIETHVAQTDGECWALGIMTDGSGCISAGNDGELKAWSINQAAIQEKTAAAPSNAINILQERGTFYRQGKDRTVAVRFHPERDVIALHGSEKAVELWRMRSESEVRKALSRKRKRKRKSDNPTDPDSGVDLEDVVDDALDVSNAGITDIFVHLVTVRTSGKVRCMDWAGGRSTKVISMLIATANNQLEVFDVKASKQKAAETPDYSRTMSVDMPGHRSDVRCLALSSDDRMLVSASHGSLKVWNTKTQHCLRTLDCGYALCATFLPGDKIVVIGTKEGTLEVYDIASSTLLDTIAAHDRDIWALQVSPDGKSLVTGSADKSAKFWQFKVIQEEILGTGRKNPKLTLVHTRTLKVTDDILSIRFSPDERLLAVSTLDNTVKVFFTDSLKLYLTLYGHKLPVLSMDISYDSKLIVTSSADKNVRVWGLDFGDCHKAFFAHQDSILAVAFVPNNNEGNGHHFFSASKDKVIKYYDGDKFEQIQKLDGHHGEIWALAIAHSGEFLVSSSHDKSIRMWQQTDEQIFLEEEREKELEELYENTLLASLDNDGAQTHTDAEIGETTDVSKQTAQTLSAGERIAEALEKGTEDLQLMREYHRLKSVNPKAAVLQRDPIFLANNNVSASAFVHSTFQKVPAASLQDALLVLSFSHLPALFTFLGLWASEGRNIQLTCRILIFMLKAHQKQIVSTRAMRLMLEDVRDKLRQTLEKQKYELGFNLAGLRVIGRRIQELGESDYVDEAQWSSQQESLTQGKKRSFINIA